MHIMDWKGNLRARWIISNRPPSEIRFIFCDVSYWGEYALDWEGIRQYRKNKRESLRLLVGTELTPEYGTPESERELIKKHRQRVAPKTGGAALKLMAMQVPEEHLRYHEALQAALAENGSVDKARFSDWQSLTKDSDGEAQIHDLHGSRFEVAFDYDPKWPPVNRVESVRLARREKAKNPDGVERAFIFSDIQIPHHDESALEVALAVLAEVKPDRVVFIGDLLDLSAWSKYEQQPEWATATQGAINRAHQLMATVRKMLPAAQIQVIEANHEARMPKNLLRNAQAAYGLKRADKPDSWPVMSVPYLTAMDTLDVEWVPGYPANRVYLSPELQIIHGTTAGRGNAGRIGRAQKTSTIFGHDHRLSMDVETINSYEGGEQIYSYGVGCLCRIDGHVPSVKQGRDLSGQPVRNLENWSQGFLIANYVPDGGPFHVEQIAINTLHDYQTMFRGKVYKP